MSEKLTFARRLELAADRYVSLYRHHPRHAWGRTRDGEPNIPNTAEVLTILRCARRPYTEEAVQAGLNYLATRVFIHPLPGTRQGGRWPLTRWLVYGLMGLTQWPDWQTDHQERHSTRLTKPVTVVKAVIRCERWLEENRVDSGWSDRSDQLRYSVLQTAMATVALDRVNLLGDRVAEARDGLADRQLKDGSWSDGAPLRAGKRPTGTASHTALAVLALANGSEVHRDKAYRGCEWLHDNVDEWRFATESEKGLTVEEWDHMTFSLALRACLRMRVSVLESKLAPTIEFLDQLWIGAGEEEYQWRAGLNDVGSVHAGHGVVMAYEQIRRAQKTLDPIDFFDLVKAAAAVDTEMHERLTLSFDEAGKRFITITDVKTSQSFQPISLGPSAWPFLRRLAKLQYEGKTEQTSVPLDKLHDKPQNARVLIGRVNRTVRVGTENRVAKLIDLPAGAGTCTLRVRPTA